MEWIQRINVRCFPNKVTFEDGIPILNVYPSQKSRGRHIDLKFPLNVYGFNEVASRFGVARFRDGQWIRQVPCQQIREEIKELPILDGKKKRSGRRFGSFILVPADMVANLSNGPEGKATMSTLDRFNFAKTRRAPKRVPKNVEHVEAWIHENKTKVTNQKTGEVTFQSTGDYTYYAVMPMHFAPLFNCKYVEKTGKEGKVLSGRAIFGTDPKTSEICLQGVGEDVSGATEVAQPSPNSKYLQFVRRIQPGTGLKKAAVARTKQSHQVLNAEQALIIKSPGFF